MDAQRRRIVAVAIQNANNAAIMMFQVVQRRRRRRRRADRRWWVRPWIGRRIELGLYDQLMVELRREDPRSFTNFMRMSVGMYDEVVARLTPRLITQGTNYRLSLDPGLKVALTLRHLASGAKYRDMQYAWRVPHNTMSRVVREVCQAIIEEYLDEVMTFPNTPQAWREVADNWYLRWNFPHTMGAIDGKHVAIKCPPNSGSEYYNYKGFFSIILFAMVDSDYKFMWADVSAKGVESDAQIYNDTELKEALEADSIVGWPRPEPLPHDDEDVPYFIVGDDAFSLRTYLMKPYSLKHLTKQERVYNYRLSRARRVVENTFGILANRFRVLLTTMEHHPDNVRTIVKACVLLHNLMRIRFPTMQNRLVDIQQADGGMRPGTWREGLNLVDTVQVQAPNRASRLGKLQRNLLKHWCNSRAGAVPWQDAML